MKNVTLRQLLVFAAAARHIELLRAPPKSCTCRSRRVSTQIKSSRPHVGFAAVQRIGRKTFLTPAGEEMLQCARAITQRLREPKTPWRSSRA